MRSSELAEGREVSQPDSLAEELGARQGVVHRAKITSTRSTRVVVGSKCIVHLSVSSSLLGLRAVNRYILSSFR